jgi:hypothetical protein
VKTEEDVSLWGWGQNASKTVIYNKNIVPIERGTNTDSYGSACGNGNQDNNKGYACPHMMMFSPDMLFASMYDGIFDSFLINYKPLYCAGICNAR